MFGVDYSVRTVNPRALTEAGVQFVCRYVSTPGNPKNITKLEAVGLRGVGLGIVFVFETTANRALGGRAAGIVDARSAEMQVEAVGAPLDQPIYFAVDFDATPQQQKAINAYLEGAAATLGKNRVGVYGGYYVVKRALDAGACTYAWQTYAWSGGQWDPRAHIQQYRNGQQLAGMEVDFDRSMKTDFGQWPRHDSPIPPPPKPAVFPKDDSFWTWLRWYTGSGEFEVFGRRDPDIRPNVPQRLPAAWWRGLRSYLTARRST